MTDEQKASEILERHSRLVEDPYLRSRLVPLIVEGISYGRAQKEAFARADVLATVKREIAEALDQADPHGHACGPDSGIARRYAEVAALTAVEVYSRETNKNAD